MACCLLLVITGCQTVPSSGDILESIIMEELYRQTRIFPTDDEIRILNACVDLLLDQGFQIKEVESRLGWIDGSKVKRIDMQGIVGLQSAHASIVTRLIRGHSSSVAVRVIFHCPVYRSRDFQILTEVKDQAVYQEFFSKLSQAIFLEAQQL